MRIPPRDPKESEGIEGKAGVIRPDREADGRNGAPCRLGLDSDLSFVSDGLAGVRSPLESRDVCGPHPGTRGLNPDPRILTVFTPAHPVVPDTRIRALMGKRPDHGCFGLAQRQRNGTRALHALPSRLGEMHPALDTGPAAPDRTETSSGPRTPHLSFSRGPE